MAFGAACLKHALFVFMLSGSVQFCAMSTVESRVGLLEFLLNNVVTRDLREIKKTVVDLETRIANQPAATVQSMPAVMDESGLDEIKALKKEAELGMSIMMKAFSVEKKQLRILAQVIGDGSKNKPSPNSGGELSMADRLGAVERKVGEISKSVTMITGEIKDQNKNLTQSLGEIRVDREHDKLNIGSMNDRIDVVESKLDKIAKEISMMNLLVNEHDPRLEELSRELQMDVRSLTERIIALETKKDIGNAMESGQEYEYEALGQPLYDYNY